MEIEWAPTEIAASSLDVSLLSASPSSALSALDLTMNPSRTQASISSPFPIGFVSEKIAASELHGSDIVNILEPFKPGNLP